MLFNITGLIKILFWGAIIFYVWRMFKQHSGSNVTPKNALAIVEERYAKGEISREEYYRLKDDLINK